MASAREVEERFSEFTEQARHEPVMVEKMGRQYVVMVNYEEFERPQVPEDRCWAAAAAEAEKSGFIGHGEAIKLLTEHTAK